MAQLSNDCFVEGGGLLTLKAARDLLAADYAAVLRLTRAYFDRKGPAIAAKLFHQNAAAFYRPPVPK